MQALKQEVYIGADHQLKITVPNNIPTGKSEIFLIFQTPNDLQYKSKRILGGAKGKIKMSEDFDAPLPDEILNGFYS
jgi:hypothetical protein